MSKASTNILKIGIVIGKFNPLHPGHLKLIHQALEENDQLIIGLGSTQDPTLPTSQSQIEKLTEKLKTTIKPYQIHSLVDQNSPENWVKYLKNKLKLEDFNINTLYKADPMNISHQKQFIAAGIKIKILPRFTFEYKFHGKTYSLSSASEIRSLQV